MPRSLNKVLLIGYIADEPTIRDFAPDRKVANLTLVTNDFYRNPETGANEEVPEWHHLSCWGNLANTVDSYVHKGSRLYVEGRIKTRTYTDRDGNKRYATDIRVDSLIMLDSRRDGAGNGVNADNGVPYTGGDNGYQGMDASQTGRSNTYYPQGNMGHNAADYNRDPNTAYQQPSMPTSQRGGSNPPAYKTFNTNNANGAANGNGANGAAAAYPPLQGNAFPPMQGNAFPTLNLNNFGGAPQDGGNGAPLPKEAPNQMPNPVAVPGMGMPFNNFGNSFDPAKAAGSFNNMANQAAPAKAPQGNVAQGEAANNSFAVPQNPNKPAAGYNSPNSGSNAPVEDEIPF